MSTEVPISSPDNCSGYANNRTAKRLIVHLILLSLPLFVTRILADDAHDSLAADN
jgi:hypothetical protein